MPESSMSRPCITQLKYYYFTSEKKNPNVDSTTKCNTVVQQGAVAFLVVLLYRGHATELGGQFGEALGL